ncbi:hypothetical protein WDW37_14025 [Bdellovibrionota bacterium FG-1]
MKKRPRLEKRRSDDGVKIKAPDSGPPFTIRMGLPHMDALWADLTTKQSAGKLTKNEEKLYKKWGKALRVLSTNPSYPGLNSHEIGSLTQKYGKKVFESYLENRTPGAARMFWTYGPGRAEITILALDPHPESASYGRVKLDVEP